MESRMPGQAVSVAQLPFTRTTDLLPMFDETTINLPGPPLFGVSVELGMSTGEKVAWGAGLLAVLGLGVWGVQRLRRRPRAARRRR